MGMLQFDLNADVCIVGSPGPFAGGRAPELGEIGAREGCRKRGFAQGVNEGQLVRSVHVAEVGDAARWGEFFARLDHPSLQRRQVRRSVESDGSVDDDSCHLIG